MNYVYWVLYFKCMEYLLIFCNVDDFNIEMNVIKGYLRNVFFLFYDIIKIVNLLVKLLMLVVK